MEPNANSTAAKRTVSFFAKFTIFLTNTFYASIPSSPGRKRGHTFSEEVITDAASLVPISTDSANVLP